MAENSKKDILLMAVLTVTRDDILAGANELGIAEEQVTDDVIELVKRRVSQDLSHWREVVKSLVKDAIKCPLGLACSSSCAWQEVGKCVLPTGVK